MGRHKGVLEESAPYRELAQWLRSLRRLAGLTYRQMAERTGRPGCSAVTLSRADSGLILPRRQVVEAYAAACGASARQAWVMWERAVRAARDREEREDRQDRECREYREPTIRSAAAAAPPPHTRRRGRALELVYEPAHLLEAMHRLRMDAGNPSLRTLQERARAGDSGPLPRSTLADVLAGLRMPSEALLMSYVRACGERDHRISAWRAAWHRTSRPPAMPVRAQGPAPAPVRRTEEAVQLAG
ncbi:helix-turn-helix domain-containing protein [Streptomyces sp. NPDC052236]|uniref:helix-turn-helix domain-containing protein n=1 Tax=Streptomyces sp. NPDC052236 TaxID=3365686 RepID=UPI0037D20470